MIFHIRNLFFILFLSYLHQNLPILNTWHKSYHFSDNLLSSKIYLLKNPNAHLVYNVVIVCHFHLHVSVRL